MFSQILTSIGAGILVIFTAIAGWFGYQQQQNLSATIPVVVAVFETTLSSAITTSDTSMTLVTGTTKSGSTLSGYMCFTIEGGKTTEEFVCGTASSTSVTGLLRGLDPVTVATSTALAKAHRAGSNVKITDYPQLAILSRIMNGDEDYPNKIHYATDTINITDNIDIPNKLYVDSVATSGAANASLSTAGISLLATGALLASGTGTSTATLYYVPYGGLFNQTSSAANLVPVTNSSGKLSQEFLDLTQPFAFSGTSTFATSTFNNTVNIIGTTTFTVAPTSNATPTIGSQVANKNYVDSVFSLSGVSTSTWEYSTGSAGSFNIPYASSTFTLANAKRVMIGFVGWATTTAEALVGLSIDGNSTGAIVKNAPSAITKTGNMSFTYVTNSLAVGTHTIYLQFILETGSTQITGKDFWAIPLY